MNVLVIGGAGFIGSFLCNELIKNGENVVAIDNLMRGKIQNLESVWNRKEFSFFEHDANDTAFLEKVLREKKINYIFHLAANSDIQASATNPQIEFDCTAKTTWNILSSMMKCGVKNLFFASTSAVYGEPTGKKFSENDELNPISYYGSAKMASEAFIKSFAYMNNLNCLIFRFPNVIGPNLTHGVFYDFIDRLKKNPLELRVLGDGTQQKPYMHVQDLANCILSLYKENVGLNIYNVGVDSHTTVKTIAEMVVSEMGLKNCNIIYQNKNVGWKGDVPFFAYNLNKIHATGWKSSMSSDEAALRTIKEALNSYDHK